MLYTNFTQIYKPSVISESGSFRKNSFNRLLTELTSCHFSLSGLALSGSYIININNISLFAITQSVSKHPLKDSLYYSYIHIKLHFGLNKQLMLCYLYYTKIIKDGPRLWLMQNALTCQHLELKNPIL